MYLHLNGASLQENRQELARLAVTVPADSALGDSGKAAPPPVRDHEWLRHGSQERTVGRRPGARSCTGAPMTLVMRDG
jgi:hypothetical protein